MSGAGSRLGEALRDLFLAVAALDVNLQGAAVVAATTTGRLQYVNSSTMAAISKIITEFERNRAWLPGHAAEQGNGETEEQAEHMPSNKLHRCQKKTMPPGHYAAEERTPIFGLPGPRRIRRLPFEDKSIREFTRGAVECCERLLALKEHSDTHATFVADETSVKGSNSPLDVYFENHVEGAEANDGVDDFAELQKIAAAALVLEQAAKLARSLPMFLQVGEKSETTTVRRLFLLWAAARWIQDASAFAHSLHSEAFIGMQDSVRSLRCDPAIGKRAPTPGPENSPDTASLKLNTTRLAPWTGPPQGTFLTYALLHWAVSAPDAERGERASAFLGIIGARHKLALGIDVSNAEPLRSQPSLLSFLAHPAILSHGSQTQPSRQLEQQNHHQMRNDTEPRHEKCKIAGVRHVHILQQNILLCEQLLRCKRILKRLIQLLELCKPAMKPPLIGSFHAESKPSETTCEELWIASVHALRLAAFLLEASRCKSLCGIWIRKDRRENVLPFSQKAAEKALKSN